MNLPKRLSASPITTHSDITQHIHNRIRLTTIPRHSLFSNTFQDINPSIIVAELAVSSLAAYIAALWPNRPKGSSATTLIEVKPSSVSGRGVFAKDNIPSGTILGRYPGRLRSSFEMISKSEAAPGIDFSTYCFQTRSGHYLDPTNWSGEPSAFPQPGLAWFPIDVTLSYMNEPPKYSSSGVNVRVEDDPLDPENGIVFIAAECIDTGCELFVDYGLHYDRSKYGAAALEDGLFD